MNRNQFALSLAVLAAAAFAGAYFAVHTLQGPALSAQDKPGAVKGTSFELVGKDGKARASLDIDKDGEARFTMIDDKGKGRLQLNSGGNRAYVALLDGNGMVRYIVGQDTTDGTVMQTFSDKDGNNRILTNLKDGGETLTAFTGAKGENYLTLIAGPKSASSLILADPSGVKQATFFAKEDMASIQLSAAANGKVTNSLLMFAKGEQTTLQLEGGKGTMLNAIVGDQPVSALSFDGKMRLRGMLGKDGTPEFMFLDTEKKSTWKAGN